MSGHFPAKLDESYYVASQKSADREGKAQKNKITADSDEIGGVMCVAETAISQKKR